jgi:hypothetical protein
MSRSLSHKTLVALLVLATITLSILEIHQATASPLTQSEQGYDLSWWTVDSGGRTSGDETGYTLNGTIGQHDGGMLTGGDYVLSGGFWGGIAVEHSVHLPLILREH